MGSNLRLTDAELYARDMEIKRLREEGASLREISLAVGLSDGGVSHVIKKYGWPLKWTNPRKTDIDEEVNRRRRNGESLAQIAERLGVDKKVVARRADKIEAPDPYEGTKRPRRRALTDRSAAYAADNAAGMTNFEIAKKHGVTSGAVWAALKLRKKRGFQ